MGKNRKATEPEIGEGSLVRSLPLHESKYLYEENLEQLNKLEENLSQEYIGVLKQIKTTVWTSLVIYCLSFLILLILLITTLIKLSVDNLTTSQLYLNAGLFSATFILLIVILSGSPVSKIRKATIILSKSTSIFTSHILQLKLISISLLSSINGNKDFDLDKEFDMVKRITEETVSSIEDSLETIDEDID